MCPAHSPPCFKHPPPPPRIALLFDAPQESVGAGREPGPELLAAYMAYIRVEEKQGDPGRVQVRHRQCWDRLINMGVCGHERVGTTTAAKAVLTGVLCNVRMGTVSCFLKLRALLFGLCAPACRWYTSALWLPSPSRTTCGRSMPDIWRPTSRLARVRLRSSCLQAAGVPACGCSQSLRVTSAWRPTGPFAYWAHQLHAPPGPFRSHQQRVCARRAQLPLGGPAVGACTAGA